MYYRGYTIDDKVYYNDKNQKYMWIGMYKVIQRKDNFIGVYSSHGRLITHSDKWKKATKIAKLMLDAYCDGCDSVNDY